MRDISRTTASAGLLDLFMSQDFKAISVLIGAWKCNSLALLENHVRTTEQSKRKGRGQRAVTIPKINQHESSSVAKMCNKHSYLYINIWCEMDAQILKCKKKTLPEGIFQPLHKRRDINLIRMSDFASMSDTILKGEHRIWRGANQGGKYTPHPASLWIYLRLHSLLEKKIKYCFFFIAHVVNINYYETDW